MWEGRTPRSPSAPLSLFFPPTQSSLTPCGGARVGCGMQPHMSDRWTAELGAVAACHRSTSWRKLVLFTSRDLIFKDLTIEVNAFASPDLLKRTELFNAQPCSSSLLAVRCCPSTTHRSSSSSPVEATCRFLFRLLVIDQSQVSKIWHVLVFFNNTARNYARRNFNSLKWKQSLVALGVLYQWENVFAFYYLFKRV